MAIKLQFDKSDTSMKMAGARMYKYADDPTATEDGQCLITTGYCSVMQMLY